MKKSKISTVKQDKKDHHYGSFGFCFSFGLRNNYGLDSSGIYSYTYYANDEVDEMDLMKRYLSENLLTVFQTFHRIVPGISSKLQEVGKTVKYLCNNHGMLNVMEKEKHVSALTANININAGTRTPHCEKDVSYTIIHVPPQKSSESFILFQFQINDNIDINLKCVPGTCFTYSAYCLTHRQLSSFGSNCMNISTYIGKRVFDSFKTSFWRKRKKDEEKLKSWMNFS